MPDKDQGDEWIANPSAVAVGTRCGCELGASWNESGGYQW
jgi:hypothetical protein